VLEDFDGAVRFDCDVLIDRAHYADDGEDLHLSLNNVQVSFVEFTPQAAGRTAKQPEERLLM
jgi:hypothetical protein